MNKKILLIYTGGTIGMVKDKKKNTLVPFNFDELLKAIPELKSVELDLDGNSRLPEPDLGCFERIY